jgi:lipoprotein-anchoring transpeptidase ErfK/SrfK
MRGRRGTIGKRHAAAVLAGTAALLALAACTSSGGGAATGDDSSSVTKTASGSDDAPSKAPAPAAVVTFSTKRGEVISPAKPVTVRVDQGTLASVTMTNSAGREVSGEISADKLYWHNTEDLGYGRTYHITAVAKNKDGVPVTRSGRITTLTPNNMTLPYIDDLYGAAIQNGGKYGVAMVVNVAFDEQIPDKAAAERALQVTTIPHVDGAWNWVDASHAHWRPEHYFAPGTKVIINAKVYGVRVGPGLYGQSDVKRSFTIGRKQLTIANDTAPHSVNKVRVYDGAGSVIRTMNTSMGTHGGERVGGNYINFYTLDGTYTVLGHENPARMCSDSYGLPANAPGGYGCENIPYGTKISTDGIYLHELDATVWAQDSGQDVSHGCLNLNQANAQWFFNHSLVGDPVVIHGAKGAPKIQLWQGGDWSVPWSSWLKGSAL